MYNWWIDLSGFSVVRRDRTDRRGGGVCVYIRDNISLIISCAASWFGRSSTWIFMVIVETSSSTSWYEFTILGAIYHPPGNDDSVLLNHITESLDGVLCSHPNAGIIIAGDFNQFKHSHLCNLFNLKQTVKHPTRGNNILDKVFTNISKFHWQHFIDQWQSLDYYGNQVSHFEKTIRMVSKKFRRI